MKTILPLIVTILSTLIAGCDGQSGGSGSSSGSSDKAVILAVKVLMMSVDSNDGTYTLDADGWYHETASRSELAMNIIDVSADDKGKPAFDFGKAIRSTETDVADRSKGEFYKMKLTREGDTVYLEQRLRSIDELAGEINFESKDEVRFVQGDWFEYEAGDPVSFQYTDAGLKTAKKSFETQFATMTAPMMRLLLLEEMKKLKKAEGWKVSDADLGRIVHAETNVDIGKFPKTVYFVQDKKITFSEKRPLEIMVRVGMGFTTENLPKK